jgi:hypothetical protein
LLTLVWLNLPYLSLRYFWNALLYFFFTSHKNEYYKYYARNFQIYIRQINIRQINIRQINIRQINIRQISRTVTATVAGIEASIMG